MGPDAPGRVRRGLPALAALLFGLSPGALTAQVAPNATAAGVAPVGAAGRSLLLPGWGQHALGQRRGWAYLVVETALWAFWVDRRAGAAHARRDYRDLAWAEARLRDAARQDGDWRYYETLEEWTRSGAFDRDPARAGLQPEEDPATFNGAVWELAKGLYFPAGSEPSEADPAYVQALAYYERRAYGAAFLWDWAGKGDALERYRGLIRRSDDRAHQATTALGAVFANHLLAGTDAFISARVPGDAQVRFAPGRRAGRAGWVLLVRFRPSR